MSDKKPDEVKDQEYLSTLPNQEFDEAVTTMQNNIQNEIAASSSLVGNKQEILTLKSEYSADDKQYQHKIQELSKRYTHVRKTRGDGNCFFRAFGFGYLEVLLHNKKDYAKFKEAAAGTLKKLMSLNYPSFTVEDFYENFMSVVNSIGEGTTLDELSNSFVDEGLSNYFVVYLRLIASCQLQLDADFYQNFIDNGKSIVEFCKTEVEPMYQESDHIHIIALTSALNASVRVAYLDRGGNQLAFHDFPEDTEPTLHILYKPGHYDILYPR
uniref:ubiquitin thioesterase otubain-like n=1 Tax=Ciona intestinalis TaxID=7719 RepID=UPI0000523ED6|nr:ubiquitin thioesterase otubain-like [Ciona intestinalis]|eukprot:XP_002125528.1 ubiquitin thioesterase otubain-like [Ciona intestinalis]